MFPADFYHDVLGGSTLNLIYAAALFAGMVYSLFLLFFQGIGDALGHLDIDLSGHHFDLGGGHHADGSGEATGVSMLAIASFVSSFGAVGLISVSLFDASAPVSLIAALTGGIVMGILAQLFFVYILSPTVSSEVHQANLIGIVGEVITPIPSNGLGQIAFVAQGSRMTYSARATESEENYKRGTPVRIERIVGGVAYVSPID